MRSLIFGTRTAKEIIRDPLSVLFGIGFPLVLLLLMTLIQRSIPVPLFEPERLVPGIAAFALSFQCLFSAALVAKDRAGNLLDRLRTTPMTATDFIIGYLLPMLPLALLQLAVAYGAALLLGLSWTAWIPISILVLLPLAVFQISLGLLCGCCLQERQVGGICGALLTNLSAWLSGAWFDVGLVGGLFEKIANALPFANAVACARGALGGHIDLGCFAIVSIYAIAMLFAAILIARKKLI